MKKKIYLIISFILLFSIYACTGYKPIFGSSNLQFEISDHSIDGDQKLGNQIYSKLYNISQSNKNTLETKSIYIKIKTTKEKIATAKDGTGKILQYKIILNTDVVVNDYLSQDELLNHNFVSSLSYKTQDQYSETVKLENKSTDDLINRTYQNLIIMLTESIAIK